MSNAQFGMVGLGTMGRNFLLNVTEHGFSGVGYDLGADKRALLLEEGAGFPLETAESLAELAAKLERPRKIMLLVPAGKIVDAVIADLLPFLESGDIIIDGGNSHFLETERREAFLAEKGIEFLGMGVSGGEKGARYGASLMPGGKREVYEYLRPIFEAVAAKVGGEPCVTHIGASSSGHFVKMVHNGIEYGLMQILAETYDFMLRVLKMNYDQMSQTFYRWNDSELNSFLVEVTADVLDRIDAETSKPLVEMVLDKAAQKGTGKWTSQAAMDFGVPIPTIDAAVAMRQISSQKEARVLIAKKYGSKPIPEIENLRADQSKAVTSEPLFDIKSARAASDVETVVTMHHKTTLPAQSIKNLETQVESGSEHNKNAELRREFSEQTEAFLEALKHALLNSFITTYAQGLSLLQTVSVEKNYGLNLSEIAKIWRGGCIIRSTLLEEMRRAYTECPTLLNLMLDDNFASILNERREDWRSIVEKFTESRIPALCLSSALAYFDAFRSERLPANLIQAQRDYFGAHTYQRTDKDGIFHTPDW